MFFGVVLAGAIGLSQGHTVALLDRVIDRRMWNNFVVIGAPVAAATLFTIHLHAPGGAVPSSLDTARTAGFTVLVIAQLFNTLNARSETWSAFHRLFANGWLWAAGGRGAVAPVQHGLHHHAAVGGPVAGVRRGIQRRAVGQRAAQTDPARPGSPPGRYPVGFISRVIGVIPPTAAAA